MCWISVKGRIRTTVDCKCFLGRQPDWWLHQTCPGNLALPGIWIYVTRYLNVWLNSMRFLHVREVSITGNVTLATLALLNPAANGCECKPHFLALDICKIMFLHTWTPEHHSVSSPVPPKSVLAGSCPEPQFCPHPHPRICFSHQALPGPMDVLA